MKKIHRLVYWLFGGGHEMSSLSKTDCFDAARAGLPPTDTHATAREEQSSGIPFPPTTCSLEAEMPMPMPMV